jgi:hypothetical protein
MQIRNREIQVRHKRLWIGLASVAACLFVVYLVWQTFFVQSTNPPSHSPAPPSVAPQPIRPSSFQHTRRLFGPWTLAAPGSTGAPRLVMLKANGGTDVSSMVIIVRTGWKAASAPEILTVVADKKKVRIRTSDSNIFALGYKQAFILASRPDAVYGFLRNAPGKAKLVMTTVNALSKR